MTRPGCPGTQPRIRTVADIPDAELLRRAVTNAKPTTWNAKFTRWECVMHAFDLGSTYAAQLCRRFGLDPDEVVRR